MLPKILLSSTPRSTEAFAIGFFQEEKKEGKAPSSYGLLYMGEKSKTVDALRERLKQSQHFFGKRNEVSTLRFYSSGIAENTVLVGFGAKSKWGREEARQTGAAVYHSQKREKFKTLSFDCTSLTRGMRPNQIETFLGAFCEGYLMAGYEFKELKKAESEGSYPESIELVASKIDARFVERIVSVVNGVNMARRLGDLPGNYLTPAGLFTEVQSMARGTSLTVKALGKNEILKEKMGLLWGVGKGSTEEPKLIIMEHLGGRKSERPIVLIGKGITFDSGGISIKPASSMDEMKYDMMGAATVVGSMQAIAQLKLKRNVIGMVASAENMPDGAALKPGDVIRSMSGKTVEITNTDAEGRLVLADALEYAQKYYNPLAMIDFATLTGAVGVALGHVTSGIMGNHQGLIKMIRESGEYSGERVWELPLYDEYDDDLKSNYADIRNSGNREAGSSKGGCFLRKFVDSKYPWVHCDIASTSYHIKDLNYHPSKYASGVMVRLVSHLIEHWKGV